MARVLEKATLAGGCFWCTEAIFKRLRGVREVVSGYSGGEGKKPSYEDVSRGTTGHAEAVQITFDPQVISYEILLEVFFKLHDPTTLNRQGADVGAQYRSVIFCHNSHQRRVAEKVKEKIEKSGMYKQSLRSSSLDKLGTAGLKSPVITEIVPLVNFYKAEDYHQDFYGKNRLYPYCRIIIDPKITKLYKNFGEIVKRRV